MSEQLLPISLDIETSGINIGKCGIWQIGAIELGNPENQFLEEARIDDENAVERGALKVIGKTEEELRDSSKQSQKQLILNFMEWIKTCKVKIIMGHNIGWDLTFLQNKCITYGITEEFRKITGYKSLDTHTIAQIKYLKVNGGYLLKETGKSAMNLKKVLDFCGIPDKRIKMEKDEIKIKGTPHNALEDAKLTAECFSRLINGKNLFPEYSKYEIPKELRE